jgi:heme A synthase
MTETRARIDQKIDILQARLAGAREQTTRAAGAAVGVIAVLLAITWMRRRRTPVW